MNQNSEIRKLRCEIDEIHKSFLQLFLKRVELSKEIWRHKIEQAENLQDFKREQDLLEQFDDMAVFLSDPQLNEYYKKVVKVMIDGNKAYLKEKIIAQEKEKLKIEHKL
jgi:chorismate mutase